MSMRDPPPASASNVSPDEGIAHLSEAYKPY